MKFMLLFSRQGKVRLQKWFNAIGDKERKKITRELVNVVLARRPKMSNFLDWRNLKVSYSKSLKILISIEKTIVKHMLNKNFNNILHTQFVEANLK